MKNARSSKPNRTKVFEHLYTTIVGDMCIYCGDPKEEIDHCPPIQWVKILGPDQFDNFYKVPCCLECNRVLGAKDLFKVTERQIFIYEHLRVTEWDLRMQPPHDPDTIDEEYSGRLRDEVRNHVFRQVRAWARFEYAERKANVCQP